MTQAMGFEGRLEFVEETNYGAASTSLTMIWIGSVNKFTIVNKIEKKTRHRLRTRGATTQRTPSGIANGKQSISAKVEWSPQATGTVGNYMSFVAELIGTSTGIADTRKSIMLNAVHKDGTVEGPLKGCVSSYLSVKCGVGQDVMMDAEVLANAYDPSAPLDVTSTIVGATDCYQIATECDGEVLEWTDCEIQISSTSQDLITDFEFKIDNKTSERHRLKAVNTPAEIMQGPAEITGKCTFDLEDNVELLRMLSLASFAMAIKIGAFTWTFAGCEWESATVDQDNENPVQIVLPWKALSVAITTA